MERAVDGSAGVEPATGNYFVSAYPPFSSWSEEEVDRYVEALDRPAGAPHDPGLGLYVHIPFCAERCAYCYYLSHARRTEEMDRYLDAVAGELELYAGRAAFAERSISFVYFGGGTPSMLSTARLDRLFERLQTAMPWSAAREVTFECAPKSVTETKCRALRSAGVTRISMGVQQLDDSVLQLNGRIHLVSDVERAYDRVRSAGFAVVNLDLIAGLVGETDESFDRSLERVIDLAPESVTIYQLEIPRNTPLYRAIREGTQDPLPVGWETKRERMGRGFARLESAGYSVRSAYAAVRDPGRHEFVYQDAQYRGADLIGIGVASFAYLQGVHHQNLASLDAYLDARDRGELPLGRAHALGVDERIVREFVLQLKLGHVPAAPFRGKFGVDPLERFAEPLERFRARGWLDFGADEVVLTREGLLRADRLVPAFYLPEHRSVRYS